MCEYGTEGLKGENIVMQRNVCLSDGCYDKSKSPAVEKETLTEPDFCFHSNSESYDRADSFRLIMEQAEFCFCFPYSKLDFVSEIVYPFSL